MIIRLVGILACALVSAHAAHAEVDFDFSKLDGHFFVNGEAELSNIHKSSTAAPKVVHRTVPLEVVLKNSTRNSFTLVWFPADAPHHIANTIRWSGMPHSPMGDLEVGGVFPLQRSAHLIGGFHASIRMHRTEDGHGVILEAENLAIHHEFDWKRLAMPHFRMVIRPGKIVIHQTSDVFNGGVIGRQKLTAEIDY
jgi:hypothetical protein